MSASLVGSEMCIRDRHLESGIATLNCIEHQYHMSNSSNINVRTVCPGPTRHPFHTFDERRSVQGRQHQCSVYEANITTSYCIKQQQNNNANVRSVCSGPTQHPFHTFNEQRLTQSRHHHYCSVFEQHAKVSSSYCIQKQ